MRTNEIRVNDGNAHDLDAHDLDAHAGRARTVPSTQSVYPEPEVTQKPVRRQFTAEYKLRILQEAERCTPSERGALLRREGLYSSILTKWHRQSKRGAQEALAAKQRGPKGASPQDLEITELKEKVAKLKKALQQAHAIIDL